MCINYDPIYILKDCSHFKGFTTWNANIYIQDLNPQDE